MYPTGSIYAEERIITTSGKTELERFNGNPEYLARFLHAFMYLGVVRGESRKIEILYAHRFLDAFLIY